MAAPVTTFEFIIQERMIFHMYINLNGTIDRVGTTASQGDTTTITIKGQSNINAVLDAIGSEVRLYSDEACTTLVGLYKSAKVLRVSYEPEKMAASVTFQGAKVSDLTEEQLRADMAAQAATITAQAAKITALEEELAAAKILLGIEESAEEGEA